MSGGAAVDNLFPAIAQSFAIILTGYLFGLFKIIPPSEARAISELVGKLALPALLFQNLATLDLTAINWGFMSGILIAKVTVFIVTALMTLVLSRPFNIGRAALFGIFTTQSNDFALGLPIVQALYGATSPPGQFNYSSYMYLLAPISLVIINPVAFLLMEYWKQSHHKRVSCADLPRLLLITLKGVILNPVIFMTALGVIYNLVVHFGIFHGRKSSERNIPHWFGGFLSTLGGAYAACALLQIGIFMVGKLKKITGMLIIISSLLIFAKTILLPIVADRVLYLILPAYGANASLSRDNISTFGFLYGTFPTAPTVFVFASQYNLAMEIVASSIVLCTFMSAPIMYVSARLVLIPETSVSKYTHIIENTRRDVTVIAGISVVWVLLLFICAKRYRSYLHVFVMHYMVALVLEVVGGELLDYFSKEHQVYWQIFSFGLFFPGVLASRLWTALIAFGLTLLLFNGHRVAERLWLPLMLFAWGIPISITVIMVVVCALDPSRLHGSSVDATFLFGNVQLVVSVIVLIFSFIVGLIFLVLSSLKIMRNEKDMQSPTTSLTRLRPTKESQSNSEDGIMRRGVQQYSRNYGSTSISESNGSVQNSTKTFFSSKPQHDESHTCAVQHVPEEASSTQAGMLDSVSLQEDLTQLIPPHNLHPSDNQSTFKDAMRFIILLLFLLFSCLVGILVVFWKLISSRISGIFIGISVLDTITNFGQGFFVFVAFGFEKHWFWMALYKRFYMKVYEDVFVGSDFVDWLLEKGLVRTREDAVQYGHSLLLGRILTHVTNEHYFYDDNYFYRFTT